MAKINTVNVELFEGKTREVSSIISFGGISEFYFHFQFYFSTLQPQYA